MLLLIFYPVLQVLYKMKPTNFPYKNVKHKMKFGSQELPVLTNEFYFPGREAVNDKFCCLVDNIWNIPKYTESNEQFVLLGEKSNYLCST